MFWKRGTSGKYWVNSVGFTQFWLTGDAPVSLTWCWKWPLITWTSESCTSVTVAGFLLYIYMYILIIYDIMSTYVLRQWDLQSAWNKRAASLQNLNLGPELWQRVQILSFSGFSGLWARLCCFGFVWFWVGIFVCLILFFCGIFLSAVYLAPLQDLMW